MKRASCPVCRTPLHPALLELEMRVHPLCLPEPSRGVTTGRRVRPLRAVRGVAEEAS